MSAAGGAGASPARTAEGGSPEHSRGRLCYKIADFHVGTDGPDARPTPPTMCVVDYFNFAPQPRQRWSRASMSSLQRGQRGAVASSIA